MENFDAIRWFVRNDMTTGFNRATYMFIEMLQKDAGLWAVSAMSDLFPYSSWLAGPGASYSVLEPGDENKEKILKIVIDRKLDSLDVCRGSVKQENCRNLPGTENIYLMKGAPYSLMIDKNTGFFKSYYYIDQQFKGNNVRLAQHFREMQHEKMDGRFSCVVKLPYGAAREVVAGALKFAVETSEKKKWFALELHSFMLGQIAQYQK